MLHPARARQDACVGDVDAIGPDGHVVEELGSLELDAGHRDPGAPVEAADGVDVRHPERVVLQREPLGPVELHAVDAAGDELQRIHRAVPVETRDVTVAVLGARPSVDVGDVPDVELFVVLGGLGVLKALEPRGEARAGRRVGACTAGGTRVGGGDGAVIAPASPREREGRHGERPP